MILQTVSPSLGIGAAKFFFLGLIHIRISFSLEVESTTHKPMKFLIRFPSSRLRLSAIPSKSLSSTPLPNWVESSSISEPLTTTKIQTCPKSSDRNAVEALLSHKNDPQRALDYANWAGKQRGFQAGDSFFVLLHILVRFPNYHNAARSLIYDYVCHDSAPSCVVAVDCLIDCAERYGFWLKPRLFDYFLNGYVRAQRYKDAEDCFYALVSRRILPCHIILNNFLKCLIRANMIDNARGLFKDVVSKGSSYDCDTVYMMMCASLRDGRVEEAEKYFLEARNSGIKIEPHVYASAVRAACMKLESDVAVGLLSEMKDRGWVPPEGTFTLAICTCVKQRNVTEALRLKEEMINSGHFLNLVVATSLIKGYYQQGDLNSSLALFDKIVEDGLAPNKVTFAVTIEGCCVHGNMEKAKELYHLMKTAGIQPTVYTVNSIVRGYLRIEMLDEAMGIFDGAVKDGIANIFSYNDMLSWFCGNGRLDDAYEMWNKMIDRGVEPTVVSYNNMILGNCRKGNMDVALNLLSEMAVKNLKPNVVTYSILIDGHFRKGETGKAIGLFDLMINSGIVPTNVTFHTVISGLCKAGQTTVAKESMEKYVSMGFKPGCMTYNCLINGFIKEGVIDSALAVYDEMCRSGLMPNVVTYTTLIHGFCRGQTLDLALNVWNEMRAKKIRMDVTAYNALIDAFCKRNDMKCASQLFDELIGAGLSPTTAVYNTMIGGFRNLYDMDSALNLYKRMRSEGTRCDLKTYTTLIDGLLKVGNIELATVFYQKMLAKNIMPDVITYSVLIHGLCNKGQLENARKVLDEMLSKSVTPNALIYNTLIGRNFKEGNFQEAFRLHDEMLDSGLATDDTTFDILLNDKHKKKTSHQEFFYGQAMRRCCRCSLRCRTMEKAE